jgi:hypothetical protein
VLVHSQDSNQNGVALMFQPWDDSRRRKPLLAKQSTEKQLHLNPVLTTYRHVEYKGADVAAKGQC